MRGLPPHRTVADDRQRATFRLDFDADGRPVALRVDGGPSPEELPSDTPLLWQLDALLTIHIAEQSPAVFVHAGAVGYRGRGVLLPGGSFAGKTTLTAALLACGAEYLSDDFAVIDSDGCVHPYHCPLRLRTSAGRRDLSPEAFGAVRADAPVRPILIVDTRYEAGARWRPSPLSRGEGVLRLLAQAPAARSAPKRVAAALAQVARSAVCVTGPRGDATETARQILAYCETLTDPSNSHLQVPEATPCCLLRA